MRLGIQTKLFGSFGVVLCLSLLVAAVGISGMRDMNAQTTLLTDNRIPGLYRAEEAAMALTQGNLSQAAREGSNQNLAPAQRAA